VGELDTLVLKKDDDGVRVGDFNDKELDSGVKYGVGNGDEEDELVITIKVADEDTDDLALAELAILVVVRRADVTPTPIPTLTSTSMRGRILIDGSMDGILGTFTPKLRSIIGGLSPADKVVGFTEAVAGREEAAVELRIVVVVGNSVAPPPLEIPRFRLISTSGGVGLGLAVLAVGDGDARRPDNSVPRLMSTRGTFPCGDVDAKLSVVGGLLVDGLEVGAPFPMPTLGSMSDPWFVVCLPNKLPKFMSTVALIRPPPAWRSRRGFPSAPVGARVEIAGTKIEVIDGVIGATGGIAVGRTSGVVVDEAPPLILMLIKFRDGEAPIAGTSMPTLTIPGFTFTPANWPPGAADAGVVLGDAAGDWLMSNIDSNE
jgi:hypothetical protein